MEHTATIAITGAAGFIASYMTGYLNQQGFENLILVDDFSVPTKMPNLEGKKYLQLIDRNNFMDWFKNNPGKIQHLFHLGARTDTTEMDYSIHKKWNLDYSKALWEICCDQQIPMVYASSAATYGGGEHGYSDDHASVPLLKPLNPYGQSKQDFDVWALGQAQSPPFWAGVKFFNVYGPNEYHKGRMASVILHAHKQIAAGNEMKLFRSHNPDYTDGGQMRDFVYVADVVKICIWLMDNQPTSGLYNAGSGTARTFLDLAKSIFAALSLPEKIDFVDTPEDIRDKYQYFTEANMQKLRKAGFPEPATSLEQGVSDYVQQYLQKGHYF